MLYYKGIEGDASDYHLLGMFSFFRPLTVEVWLSALVSLIVYGFAHQILCFLSPMEKNSPQNWVSMLNAHKPPATPPPNALWSLSNSLWLAISAVLQQGCDFIPSTKSTRILFVCWGFVSLILCSYYSRCCIASY